MASLRLVKVSKSYGNVKAIKKIDLQVKDGELMVLLGPTGAGKTTTLRSVAGLEHPEEGEIYIDEIKVNGLSPADRDVAFVFQNYSLYPRYTVFDNMASPLRAHGIAKDEIEKVVRKTSDILHITHLLQRKPEHLSGGEMQRVALGRALVRKPKVFLMDEPLTNLDAKLREEMRAQIKRLQKDIKATFFYATPDQAEALSMADRIAVLRDGEIQQIDSSSKIYNHPTNMFVASFLGSPGMNFISCEYKKGGMLDVGPGIFNVTLSPSQREEVERKVVQPQLVFGIRPEDILVNKESYPDWINSEVDVVELMGSWNVLSLKIKDCFVKARVPADFEVEMGDKVKVKFNIPKIHLFDSSTEKAIL